MTILTSTPVTIERAQSPYRKSVNNSAKLASRGNSQLAPLSPPAIFVSKCVELAASVSRSTARGLCGVARSALHGFKAETRFDPSVRDTWDVANSRISESLGAKGKGGRW